MVLNHVKLGCAVTSMKYLTSVVSLIFLPKTLSLNNLAFLASNSLKLAEILANVQKKIISKNIHQY